MFVPLFLHRGEYRLTSIIHNTTDTKDLGTKSTEYLVPESVEHTANLGPATTVYILDFATHIGSNSNGI